VIELYLLITVVVVLAIGIAALFLLVLRRLRARKLQLLNELSSSPRLVADRAFNRLAMARREADLLGRQGTDTGRARELIAQSQAAFDQSQYSRSYELAQSAHEALVHARQTGALASSPAASTAVAAAPAAPPSPASAPRGPDAPGGSPSFPAPVPRLAPNRAESQFQMHLLDSDLDRARGERTSPATLGVASALRNQAQAAFDAGQYTDALRFSLKGRRELGGRVETLAASPTPAGPAADEAPVDPTAGDPATAAERTAGGSRCAQCGYPTRSDDTFCRGCGRPLSSPTCPTCGAPRTAADLFCGRCGARFS
jgi:hypothetical protein